MGTYVVGDIHGYYEAWMSLKAKIERLDEDARFVFVGDIIDRGPNSLKMLEWAMEHIELGGKYQMILGNHEDMKIEWWNRYKAEKKGNPQLSLSMYEECYDFHKVINTNSLSETDVEKMIAFFEDLPLVIELDIPMKDKTQHYIIAHGEMKREYLTEEGCFDYKLMEMDFFDDEKEKEIKSMCRDTLLWGRNFFGNYWEQETVFLHGHTPTNVRDLVVRGATPGAIDFRRKDINVDCGIAVIGEYRNLGAIRLEDREEFYLVDVKKDELLY